jgi:DNA invertase Pin-like site-specific DNA recombinase
MEKFRALRLSERNSLRTKEALAAKRMQGVVLGKPKGTIQKSKFDKDEDRIKELLKLGYTIILRLTHMSINEDFGYHVALSAQNFSITTGRSH